MTCHLTSFLAHVDESAVSGFGGDYEYDDEYYDYSDDTDYSEEEQNEQGEVDDDDKEAAGKEEAILDDNPQDLEVDNRQEELHLPDRKVSFLTESIKLLNHI